MDEILRLPGEFLDAELRADAAALDALLTDDFRSIGEQGFVLDKAQWIGRFGDFRYLALEPAEVDVRCYEACAIVRSIQVSRAEWHGQPMTLRTRTSHVWVRLGEGWRLAGLQFSSLPPP